MSLQLTFALYAKKKPVVISVSDGLTVKVMILVRMRWILRGPVRWLRPRDPSIGG